MAPELLLAYAPTCRKGFTMKYIVAWALGIPGGLAVGWFLFSRV
jgi:hypothetical protein